MYAAVVNCLLKCMQHTGTHTYLKCLNNCLKLPSLFFQMIISRGSKGAFICSLSTVQTELSYLKTCPSCLLLVLSFSTHYPVPLLHLPTGFSTTDLARVPKYLPHSLCQIEDLTILGTCQKEVINSVKGQTLRTCWLFLNCQGLSWAK